MNFTQEIFDRINSFGTIQAGCKAIAAETGYTINTVVTYYYKFKRIHNIKHNSKKEKTLNKYADIALEVSKHPDNIAQALKIVAKKYNTTYEAMHSIYYRKIKNNPKYPIFNIVSKKSSSFNVKNNINNKYQKYETNYNFVKQTWKKIKDFINNLKK